MTKPVEMWPGMTRTAFDALKRYISDMGDRLGLKDWEFILSTDPCDDPTNRATVNPTYGQKRAVITVCRDFMALEDGEKREAIVHELIHCHLDCIARACHNVQAPLGQMVYPVWYESVKDAIEWATDGLASAIAGRFPPYQNEP